ncbi:hypothetical protein [Kitasatospora sp. Root107]|nr:hypothetical protein [Kitasatospora sp. Root107]KQV05611.1 hypothetical protein ASC99_12460 [Kitasatospora sp. Root107]KRB62414.1 hypothetical protein ASE03_07410 [Kitasatospora sp. Root187]
MTAADLWQAVMDAHGHRCWCTGQCGKKHKADDGGIRCQREDGGHGHRHGGGTVRLIAAPARPADLLLPPHRVAALPAGRLAAWCPGCHHGALAAARKQQRTTAHATEPDALFNL